MQAGNHFPYSRPVAAALGAVPTVLLLHLANVGQAKADAEGFVWASPRFVTEGTGLDYEQQRVAFAILEHLGAITVEFRRDHDDRRRYVRVNLRAARRLASKGMT
jgi:hypothetical protein